MLPALPAGSKAATKHEQPPSSQNFQYLSPSPCLGAFLNHSWSRGGKRFHFQHVHPSGMHSQSFFFFLVEYIQWFQIIVDRSSCWKGADVLGKATGQALKEGIREKSMMEIPWQMFPCLILDVLMFNIRCKELIHCNFYSFSRKNNPTTSFSHPYAKERKFCYC